MTDRELLSLAAKAAGIALDGPVEDGYSPRTKARQFWNPLSDDGDALRLAVALHIDLRFYEAWSQVAASHGTVAHCSEPLEGKAETRRAIVRAAAEIERAKQTKVET